MKAKVKILNSGFYSSVQDKGRLGYAKYGVPFSGAMDQGAFGFANALLNNNENDACIEWVYRPPKIQFSEATIISLCGAEADWFLNNESVAGDRQIKVENGDVLSGSFCKNKIYGYVGIKYGFNVRMVLESRSFFNPVTSGSALQNGDVIGYKKVEGFGEKNASIVPGFRNAISNSLEVFAGPEFENLSLEQRNLLLHNKFTISGSANRMAIRLEEPLINDLGSMITSPVLPGTVQLTPSGTLIILMRDCQTTGGYPRVLQLSSTSINRIAQKRKGEQIGFELTSF